MSCSRTASCFSDMLDESKTLSCLDCLDNRHHGRTIVCADRHSTEYRLSNPDGLTAAVLKIDGGVITDDVQKCDFVILLGSYNLRPVAVLVELKGQHTNHAVDQISNTLSLLCETLCQYKVYGRIVGRRTPDIRGSSYKQLKTKLMTTGGDMLRQISRCDSVQTVQIDNGLEIVIPNQQN